MAWRCPAPHHVCVWYCPRGSKNDNLRLQRRHLLKGVSFCSRPNRSDSSPGNLKFTKEFVDLRSAQTANRHESDIQPLNVFASPKVITPVRRTCLAATSQLMGKAKQRLRDRLSWITASMANIQGCKSGRQEGRAAEGDGCMHRQLILLEQSMLCPHTRTN